MADTRKARITVDQARRTGRVVRHVEADMHQGPKAKGRRTRRTPHVIFTVLVTIDGGSSGTLSSTCSWTYTVTTLGGFELGAGMTPRARREQNVPYTETPAETEGTGYYNRDGEFVLLWANETMETQPDCPEEP